MLRYCRRAVRAPPGAGFRGSAAAGQREEDEGEDEQEERAEVGARIARDEEVRAAQQARHLGDGPGEHRQPVALHHLRLAAPAFVDVAVEGQTIRYALSVYVDEP